MALVICPMLWPLRELATSGRETSTRGIPQRAAVSASKKLSSAPKSSRADVFWVPPGQSRVTGRQVLFLVVDSVLIMPTSAPRSTRGRAPFAGQFEAKCPDSPQYRHDRVLTLLYLSSLASRARSTIIVSGSPMEVKLGVVDGKVWGWRLKMSWHCVRKLGAGGGVSGSPELGLFLEKPLQGPGVQGSK